MCAKKIEGEVFIKIIIYARCPKKKWDLHLTGYREHQKWVIDKSRVSFEKFRKFPFQRAQKLPIFVEKTTEKN